MRTASITHPNFAPERGGEGLLQEATFYINAADARVGDQVAVNKGTGGAALNARYGSTTGVDTNDPLVLPHTGENYAYFPGASNNLNTPVAGLSPAGDFEVFFKMARPSATAGFCYPIALGGVLSINWYQDGYVYGSWDVGGGLLGNNAVANLTNLTVGVVYWVRYTRVASTGLINVQWAPNSVEIPTSWNSALSVGGTQTPGNIVTAAGFLAISGGEFNFYRTVFRHVIGGANVVDINLQRDVISSSVTSFACTTGQIFTVTRTATGRKLALVTAPIWLFGTDDLMEVPDNALLNFGAGEEFTTLAVYRAYSPPAANGAILSKGIFGGATNSFSISDRVATGVQGHFSTSSGGYFYTDIVSYSNNLNVISTHRSPPIGYLNGVALTSGAPSGDTTTAINNATPLLIGRDGPGGSMGDFELTAVAIFRRDLTPAELAQIVAFFNPPISPVKLLESAELYLDAQYSIEGETFVANRGKGGSILDAKYGSTAGADTNDPVFLPHTGENYIYFPPTGAGNSITAVIPSAQCPSGDIEIIADIARENWGASAPVGHQLLWSNTPGTFDITLYGDTIYVSFFSGSYRSNNAVASIIGNGFIDGERIQIKVARISSTGAITFAWKRPTDSTWSAFGYTNQPALYAGALTPWGASDTFTTKDDVANGVKLYSLRVNNGIDGPAIYQIRGTEYVSSQSTFVATSGQTVTVGRAPTGRKTTLVTRPIWLFGTDDYLEVLDNATLDFNATDPFTVLAVVREWSTPVSFGTIIGKGDKAAPPFYQLYNNPGSVVYSFETKDAAAVARYGTGAPPTVSPGNLYLLAGGAVGTDIFGYLGNGLMYVSPRSPMGTLENSSPLKVGHIAGGAYADMEVLAVAVFRRALSIRELLILSTYFRTV